MSGFRLIDKAGISVSLPGYALLHGALGALRKRTEDMFNHDSCSWTTRGESMVCGGTRHCMQTHNLAPGKDPSMCREYHCS